MAIDGLFILNIAKKLQKNIKDARINKVFMLSNNEYIFDLYKPNLKENLFISVNQNYSYLSLTSKKYSYSNDIFHFHSILKKHIENFYIENVEQINFDRIIRLTLRGKNDIGIEVKKHFYIELMGRYNNLILTKEDDIIIDSLHRLPFIEEGKRIILPGYSYSTPFMEKKKNPLKEKFYDENLSLSKQFYGISSFLEKILLNEIEKKSFNIIIDEIINSETLYYNEKEFHLLPFPSYEKKEKLFEGLNNYFSTKADQDRINRKSSDIKRLISNYKITDSDNAHIYKEYGEILFTYASSYQRGMNKIFIDEIGIEIPLDSTKNLTMNANNYFKLYKKKTNSKKHLEEQIKIVKEELEYFLDLEVQLKTTDLNVIDEIIMELKEQNYLKQVANNKKKAKKISLLEFEGFNSKIYVGRNNLQNEYLTFKLAKPNDLFLHVKDYRGAHVVISNYQNDEETLRQAAELAAKYSSAGLSSSVPIDYTKVKYVKKLPASKPGKVILSNYKTIYIDPKNS